MTPTTDRSALILPAAIIIAGLLIGGGLYFGLANSGSLGQGGTPPAIALQFQSFSEMFTVIGNDHCIVQSTPL